MGVRRVAAAGLVVFAFQCPLASAQDSGPGKTVGAVRWAATHLLAARAEAWGLDPSAVVVTGVVSDGAYGLAQWNAGTRAGIEGFRYIWDRWWDVMQTGGGDASLLQITCAAPLSCAPATRAPSVSFLKNAGFPQPLLDRAATLPLIAQSQAAGNSDAPEPPAKNLFDRSGGASHALGGDGYAAGLRVAPNDSATPVSYTLVTRRPTQGESWVSFPGGNAWVYFTMAVANDAPVVVNDGTTLDIWCPFILDDGMKYSLTVSYRSQALGPIDASIRNNTMHFVLPRFTIPPHAEMMGVVDGNP